ncbi:MAG: hypothetical protein KFH98_00660, partial [Gemmatimonadetes bacterium]|nr:hypothetical protein [Gemmatimonadota bacterium]
RPQPPDPGSILILSGHPRRPPGRLPPFVAGLYLAAPAHRRRLMTSRRITRTQSWQCKHVLEEAAQWQ